MRNSKFILSQSNSVKFIDVCSGIGTTRVALQANGWKCVGRFEIDPVADAIRTLEKHLKENDEQIKILFDKNEICLTEDIRDEQEELEDLFKK